MRLSIRHRTRYAFAEPVVHALQRLRLKPKATQGQRILSWDMDYESAHTELEYDDQHFNTVTLVSVEQGAREVVVSCTGVVETEDNAGVIGQHSGHLPLWSFLSQTDRTRPGANVRGLLRDLKPAPDGKLDFLHALSQRIRDAVEYRTGSTGVNTTAEQAAGAGMGVCQDLSLIHISSPRDCS